MTANQKKGVYHIEPMKTQWKGEQSVSFAFDWEYIYGASFLNQSQGKEKRNQCNPDYYRL